MKIQVGTLHLLTVLTTRLLISVCWNHSQPLSLSMELKQH